MWPGILLNAVGLLGHLLAAHAVGGYRLAYFHHTIGFVVGVVVFGILAALLGWRFWRGRPDMTVLVIGVLSAIFGIWIYAKSPHH